MYVGLTSSRLFPPCPPLAPHLAEMQVHGAVRLRGNKGPEVFPDDAVPLRPVLLIEGLLDVRGDVLSAAKRKTEGKFFTP